MSRGYGIAIPRKKIINVIENEINMRRIFLLGGNPAKGISTSFTKQTWCCFVANHQRHGYKIDYI